MIRKLASWALSLVSFGGGGAAAVLIYPLLALQLYLALILFAFFTDTSAGGPLALPLMLAVATAVGIGYSALAYVVVGVSALVASRAGRRTLMFLLTNAVLLLLAVITGVVVQGIREPAMPPVEVVAWSAGIVAGGLPAWAVITSVWFGLRIARGAVRLVENSAVRPDRAVVEA